LERTGIARNRALADGIYAERAFNRMPFLADALEASGCNNTR
jgi:hypothetical protein